MRQRLPPPMFLAPLSGERLDAVIANKFQSTLRSLSTR
jgi:hypothetical protein